MFLLDLAPQNWHSCVCCPKPGLLLVSRDLLRNAEIIELQEEAHLMMEGYKSRKQPFRDSPFILKLVPERP
jgi:hypothetical protein